ncbi:iron ABC transporter permease [Stutzerimonas nosocomialis]|uniref:Iron ABC transporter permease n=1 Tax=Stutzerimonas nosocomialis TaxID=1056496 RepID=A0A5R9QAT9_9GAMM|nr:iron ABC transporter permease [Stutzerimonas nosocomialis]TLX61795.1 iron ABC transporter permease [Stutzerimonas nosocomialis]
MSSTHRSLGRMLLLAVAALLILILASLLFGAGQVSPWRSLMALGGVADPDARFVITELRLPRTLLGILVGVALGAAGTVLQSATRNPLAEPGLLGVSAGASFAVVLAVSLGTSSSSANLAVAISGALIGCALVLLVTRVRGVGDDPVRLVLAGAAFSSILFAASTLIMLHDQRTADDIRFWIIGALAGRSNEVLVWTLPGLLLGLLVLVPIIRPLAALALGETMASGLGHHPRVTRIVALFSVAILVGTAVSAAGPISFVGLVVPFIARRLAGPDVRRALLLALLIGPSILIMADIFSRLLVKPYELPIGVVTAFIGAPVLIAVVRNHRIPRL